MSERVVGFWSGHDCSFCVLNDGRPEIHTELERHNREKEPAGDSVQLMLDHAGVPDDVVGFATCHKADKVTSSPVWQHVLNRSMTTGLHVCGHHQAHAAHAFYSSNIIEALVVTLDGGGYEDAHGSITATMTAWHGNGTRLDPLDVVQGHESNVGGVWTRVTRYVFRMESGWPQGHQAGSVMALAALGRPHRYIEAARRWFKEDMHAVCQAPLGHVGGMSAKDPRSPQHPYLKRWEAEAKDDRNRFDIAAAFQQATEEHVFDYLLNMLDRLPHVTKLCLAGGVALNSVLVGKILQRFPRLDEVYVPPVPYDGGLSIGSAQHLWHHVMGRARVAWHDSFSPYLGRQYTGQEIGDALKPYNERGEIVIEWSSDDHVMELLTRGEVVSVFNGKAESGRRALGNRSIIADPRNPQTKDRVNSRVKHRQDWRPFAPSVIEEAVSRYFEEDVKSPYMSHVVRFQEWARPLLPAVVHFDGSARLQTVSRADNPWWHGFIKRWGEVSGHPVLLNSSLNDREPICETPLDAIKCFLKTELDALYFPEHALLVKKRS